MRLRGDGYWSVIGYRDMKLIKTRVSVGNTNMYVPISLMYCGNSYFEMWLHDTAIDFMYAVKQKPTHP